MDIRTFSRAQLSILDLTAQKLAWTCAPFLPYESKKTLEVDEVGDFICYFHLSFPLSHARLVAKEWVNTGKTEGILSNILFTLEIDL